VRLLLDEHLPPRLAEVLRAHGLEVIAVAAHGELRGRPDEELLALADSERRALVTRDAADVLSLMSADPGCRADPPLIPSRQFPATGVGIGRLAAAIEVAIDQAAPGQPGGRVVWLRPG